MNKPFDLYKKINEGYVVKDFKNRTFQDNYNHFLSVLDFYKLQIGETQSTYDTRLTNEEIDKIALVITESESKLRKNLMYEISAWLEDEYFAKVKSGDEFYIPEGFIFASSKPLRQQSKPGFFKITSLRMFGKNNDLGGIDKTKKYGIMYQYAAIIEEFTKGEGDEAKFLHFSFTYLSSSDFNFEETVEHNTLRKDLLEVVETKQTETKKRRM